MRWGKVIEIETFGAFLGTERGFLKVSVPHQEDRMVPISDVKIVILHQGVAVSTHTLIKLQESNIPYILCDQKYSPIAITLSVDTIGASKIRLTNQFRQSKPTKGKIWRKIIEAKVRNQAGVLERFGGDGTRLKRLASQIDDGDPQNIEAQAAKIYWKSLYSNEFQRSDPNNPINHHLNFGYAVLRSLFSRAIVSHGLDPRFGVFHRNPRNAFALSDDLMEPLRPFVDEAVKLLNTWDYSVMSTEVKQYLCQLPEKSIYYLDQTQLVAHAIGNFVLSYVRCLESTSGKLKPIRFPEEGLYDRPDFEV